VLVDGFRWNYFDQFGSNELTGFSRLRSEGAIAERLLPEFPSLSYVNYYSLMTGLHPESHGMVDNYMYDERYNTSFLIGGNLDQYHSYWWNEGEPLWITAKRQGKRSYFWYWCGCEVEIRGHRPDFCQEYLSSPNPTFDNFTDALNNAVEVLRNGSADIAGVYFEQIDVWGHYTGPESAELRDKVARVDREFARIQTVLESSRMEGSSSGSMFDQVNLVIFSDHGMVERVGGRSDNKTAVIHLMDHINQTDYLRVMGSAAGPILQIWPHTGQADWLYQKLVNANSHMKVYKKEDIPEKYHLKNHYRVPPIYLVADPGYVFLYNAESSSLPVIGYHGYDSGLHDMHGIFMARGPDFKKGGRVEALPNIDIYEMLCNVLDIQPSVNNGTVSHTCDLVSNPAICRSTNGVASFIRINYSLVVKISSLLLLCYLY